MKKKIVIICDYGYYDGGAAKVAIDSAIGLSEYGFDVTFFCGVGPVDEKLKSSVSKVICMNQFDILNNPSRLNAVVQGIYNAKAKRELDSVLSSEEYKDCVVMIHTWTKSLSSSIFDSCRKHNVKTYLTLHDYFLICPNGGLYNYKKDNICSIKPMSLKCMVCNCDRRSYFQKVWRVLRQMVQNHNIRRFKDLNYICISKFQENILKSYIKKSIIRLDNPIGSYPDDKIDFTKNDKYLFIGRVTKEKGIDIFCKAITELGKHGIVIGDGDLKEEYSIMYPNINFVGWKNKNEIYDYIKNSRCLIFASVLYETDGLVVKEATTAGIPCIVSKECAASDQIIDGVNGYLFRSNDVIDLKNRINLLDKNKIGSYILKQNNIINYCQSLEHIIDD